jgi:hypothetical protein
LDENPYQPPVEASTERSPAVGRATGRRRALWGYPVAVVLGAFFVGALLGPHTAEWDDTGAKQMFVGAIIGFVIYRFLF